MTGFITRSSRLIVIYIVTVFLAGGILTWLSLNNLSNFEELTEKRITEHEKDIASAYTLAFQSFMEQLHDSLTGLIESGYPEIPETDSPRNGLLIKEYLLMDRNGDLTKPCFVDDMTGVNNAAPSAAFLRDYQQAERSEFSQIDVAIADQLYIYALNRALTGPDSARVFNAISRLNTRQGNRLRALETDKKIISELGAALNDFKFPYAYFSINRVLEWEKKDPSNPSEQLVRDFLQGILDNEIPLTRVSEEVIQNIRKQCSAKEHGIPGTVIDSLSTIILGRIATIDRYYKAMRIAVLDSAGRPEMELGEFGVLQNESDPDEILLVWTGPAGSIGIVIYLPDIHVQVLKDLDISESHFKYNVGIVPVGSESTTMAEKFAERNMFSGYFPGRQLEVSIADPGEVKDYVFNRKLETAAGLLMLLGAMALGLYALARDVNRKKRMDRMRADFVSNVTHELKTPLTSINMFADSILLGRARNDEILKKYARVILKESEKLKRMINNILDFSRKENEKLTYEMRECDLKVIVEEVMEEMNYWLEINKFDVKIDLQEDVFSNVDPEGMKQVLSNLISNAIKYSPEDKKLQINLYAKDKKVFIEVEDRGIGIPAEKQKLIFEKFYRVSGENNSTVSGTGLGLTVSRDILEAMGGKLSVRSELRKGSKFIIELNRN